MSIPSYAKRVILDVLIVVELSIVNALLAPIQTIYTDLLVIQVV